MDAQSALEAYGYTLVDGMYVRPNKESTERWQPVDGGFLCFRKESDWGKVVDNDLIQVPFTQNASYAGVGGLHPSRQPEAFEWVWPDERIVEIYTHTGEGWVKTVDDSGKVVFNKTP